MFIIIILIAINYLTNSIKLTIIPIFFLGLVLVRVFIHFISIIAIIFADLIFEYHYCCFIIIRNVQ